MYSKAILCAVIFLLFIAFSFLFLPHAVGYIAYFDITEDTHVDSWYPYSNFGSSTLIEVEEWGEDEIPPDGVHMYGLFKCQSDEFPPLYSVVEAVFRVHRYVSDAEPPLVVLIIEEWDEMTVNWDTRPDVDSDTTGEFIEVDSGDYYCYDITDIFIAWYEDNYGLMLYYEPLWDGYKATKFHSRETYTVPNIKVTFDLTLNVQPASLGCLKALYR